MPYRRRIKQMADVDRGLVSREIFVDEDIY